MRVRTQGDPEKIRARHRYSLHEHAFNTISRARCKPKLSSLHAGTLKELLCWMQIMSNDWDLFPTQMGFWSEHVNMLLHSGRLDSEPNTGWTGQTEGI